MPTTAPLTPPLPCLTPDAGTLQPANVQPLPSRFTHCIHAYHGVRAHSRDMQRLLYLGVDEHGQGHIVARDRATGDEQALAQTSAFNYHTAATQRWIWRDQAVLFRVSADDATAHGAAEHSGAPALVHLDEPGRVHVLEGLASRSVRHVCADDAHVTGTHLDRAQGVGTVERMNIEHQRAETLLTSERAKAALPEHLKDDDAPAHFSHPVTNAREDRLFCKLMRLNPEGGSKFWAMFVLFLDTDELRCLGNAISGHPFWLGDDRHILNVQHPGDGSDNRWLVAQDTESDAVWRVLDTPLEGPGHPSQSPDGRWLATDAFVPSGDRSPIYTIDTHTGRAQRIHQVAHVFRGGTGYDPSQLTRGQPHPVWAPDSQSLLINDNQNNTQMRLCELTHFTR